LGKDLILEALSNKILPGANRIFFAALNFFMSIGDDLFCFYLY